MPPDRSTWHQLYQLCLAVLSSTPKLTTATEFILLIIYNLGRAEQDSLSLFHKVLARPTWQGLRSSPVCHSHICLLKLALNRDLLWSHDKNTSHGPLGWLLDILAAWCLGSKDVSKWTATQKLGPTITLHSTCEKLVTRPALMPTEGSKIPLLLLGEVPKNLWTSTKTIILPVKNLLEVEPESAEVSRSNYQFIGNTGWRRVCYITKWRNNK